MQSLFRQLPAMNTLLAEEIVLEWLEKWPEQVVKEALEFGLHSVREAIKAGEVSEVSSEMILVKAEEELITWQKKQLQRTINATGTILHTNLGRAPLADEAIEAMNEVARYYTNLEYDINAGERGSRYDHVKEILLELTGTEDALITNNNAAAVLLMLTTFAKEKEVLISRGELVEIGGSFRIPEVIASTGAVMHEVGATNKTHLRDYEAGINESTGALLRVHTSNYQIVGFSESVSDEALVALGKKHDVPVFNDLGSGLLMDLRPFGLSYEPTVSEVVEAGYDLVTFSGDKLLGGPQAGIIVGKREYIEALKNEPLLRALRVDKMTLASLEATLQLYLKPETGLEKLPTLAMIQGVGLEKRAEMLVDALSDISEIDAEMVDGKSQIGGGAYPNDVLESIQVRLTVDGRSASELEQALRFATIPVIGFVRHNAVYLDMRTVRDDEVITIIETVKEIVKES